MRVLACAVLSLSLSLCARATSFSTDASDLWWNSNESGWGVNVVQQADTLFMTFFVYGSNGAPTWYVAPATVYQGVSGAALVFTGPLYQTTGPWFGGAFNASGVTNRTVGSARFELTSGTAATLSYSVDGVPVTKVLSRQTWKAESFDGEYIGGNTGTWSGCTANGYGEEADTISIDHQGTSFSMRLAQLGGTGNCVFNGAYAQDGHLGTVVGTYNCASGASGTFQAVELQTSFNGFEGRIRMTSGSCIYNARLAGVRRGGL